ncbi:MAG TPA: hypothetical protein VKU60_15920, partial [Chloroflexota bacterium]|nr:hypothetical protein [Chloroflexota bacterium]
MTSSPPDRWQQALKLEENESIASILLKLEALAAREIAIVAPPHLKAFRNPVSMRLLQRKAEDLGIAVTVISQDGMTRQLCAETGFGYFPNVEAFKRNDIRREFHDRPRSIARPAVSTRFSAIAAGCILAFVLVVGYVAMPAASISVSPAATPLELDVPVMVDGSLNTVDVTGGRIPGQVQSAEVSGQATVTASGQRDQPDQTARGFVTFANLTDQPVTVPKSTILLAGKATFFTLQDAPVSPSLNVGGTAIPGSGSVAVQAVNPGPDGNVAVGAITAVYGDLASKISVKNSTATLGGSNKKLTYLSSDDQAKAKQGLLDDLRRQALDKINSQIERNQTFLPSPSSAGDGAVEELTYAESPEQVTTSTTLYMKVLVRGLAFQGDDVNQVVQQAMESAAQKQGSGAQLSNVPLTVAPPAVVSNDGGTAELQVHASGRIAPSLNASALADRVRGLDAVSAQSALQRTPGVGQANVQLWPAWARKVPSLSWRTH